jgi:hypothetical protein
MPRCEIHTANPRHALVGTGKRASRDRWIAGEKPTSPYQSGQLPRTPFLDLEVGQPLVRTRDLYARFLLTLYMWNIIIPIDHQ